MNCPYCNILIEYFNEDQRHYHSNYKHTFSYSIITENWYLYLEDKNSK